MTDAPLVSTLNDPRPPADICRANGWGPGARLIGDEGYGPEIIEITGLGERLLLAKSVSRKGRAVDGREGTWSLQFRDWRPA